MKPLVGNQAPDFKAQAVYDQEFMEVTLQKYKGKYVVLFFFPLAFTFVCPTEITAFSDRYEEFSKLNTEVLGVSVDSQFSLLAWSQQDRKEGGIGEIKYPLVADLKKEISAAYQVLSDDGISLRGLFIIDPQGTIQYSTINNLAFGRSVDETLRILQASQAPEPNFLVQLRLRPRSGRKFNFSRRVSSPSGCVLIDDSRCVALLRCPAFLVTAALWERPGTTNLLARGADPTRAALMTC